MSAASLLEFACVWLLRKFNRRVRPRLRESPLLPKAGRSGAAEGHPLFWWYQSGRKHGPVADLRSVCHWFRIFPSGSVLVSHDYLNVAIFVHCQSAGISFGSFEPYWFVANGAANKRLGHNRSPLQTWRVGQQNFPSKKSDFQDPEWKKMTPEQVVTIDVKGLKEVELRGEMRGGSPFPAALKNALPKERNCLGCHRSLWQDGPTHIQYFTRIKTDPALV
jgi:hypothetical protein